MILIPFQLTLNLVFIAGTDLFIFFLCWMMLSSNLIQLFI